MAGLRAGLSQLERESTRLKTSSGGAGDAALLASVGAFLGREGATVARLVERWERLGGAMEELLCFLGLESSSGSSSGSSGSGVISGSSTNSTTTNTTSPTSEAMLGLVHDLFQKVHDICQCVQ